MNKSKEEIQVFKTFCEVVGAAKFGDFQKRDPLDFISNDGSLGIELVSYHRDAKRGDSRGSPLRGSEARLQRLVGDAKACYEKKYKDRADVYFFPQLGPSRTTSALSTEAPEAIAILVAERLAGRSVPIPDDLASAIEGVSVSPTPAWQPESEWGIAEASWVDVNVDAIQAILDDKDLLIGDYRGRATQVWLLIHGSTMPYVGPGPDGGRWSTCGFVSSELLARQFHSSFDRVYYFDLEQKRHAQLRVTAVEQGVAALAGRGCAAPLNAKPFGGRDLHGMLDPKSTP